MELGFSFCPRALGPRFSLLNALVVCALVAVPIPDVCEHVFHDSWSSIADYGRTEWVLARWQVWLFLWVQVCFMFTKPALLAMYLVRSNQHGPLGNLTEEEKGILTRRGQLTEKHTINTSDSEEIAHSSRSKGGLGHRSDRSASQTKREEDEDIAIELAKRVTLQLQKYTSVQSDEFRFCAKAQSFKCACGIGVFCGTFCVVLEIIVSLNFTGFPVPMCHMLVGGPAMFLVVGSNLTCMLRGWFLPADEDSRCRKKTDEQGWTSTANQSHCNKHTLSQVLFLLTWYVDPAPARPWI